MGRKNAAPGRCRTFQAALTPGNAIEISGSRGQSTSARYTRARRITDGPQG